MIPWRFVYRSATGILLVLLLSAVPSSAQFAGTDTVRGDELVDEGKYEEAIVLYDRALGLEPRMAMAWCGKGVALNGLSRYQEALGAFDEAIAISPGYAKAWYEKGIALHGLGRYEEAIAAYDKALEIYPEYGYLAYYGRANALAAMGRYATAVGWYEKALLLEPGQPGAWVRMGDALRAAGDDRGAIKAYDRALALDPAFQPARAGKMTAEGNLTVPAQGTPATLGQNDTPATTGVQSPAPASRTGKTPLEPVLAAAGVCLAVLIRNKKAGEAQA